MKKILAMLLAAVLAALCCVPGLAEETLQEAEEEEPREIVPDADMPDADVLDLWDFGGESMAWLASAVPVADGVALASASVIPEDKDHLALSDRENTWEVKAAIPDGSGLLSILFFDTETTPMTFTGWPLLAYGESEEASSCTVRFADSLGSRIRRAVLSSEEFAWRGNRCLLLTLSDPAPAGSPVVTADGELAGIVVGEWAEGRNRVIALPAEEIAFALGSAADLLGYLPEWSDAPEGLAVSMDKNLVTLDWSEMDLAEPAEGERWFLVWSDTGNSYLNYFMPEKEPRHYTLLLTPGRFYSAGLVCAAGAPDAMPEELLFFFVPYAQPLKDHSFRPVCTAIAEKKEGMEEPVPVTEVTEELLRSDRAYFFSHSAYEVTEEISGLTLLVSLTDPNGVNYEWASGWVYSPEFAAEDVWSVPLKDTGLTDSLDAGGYPKGTYILSYYVNGDLADTVTFELK